MRQYLLTSTIGPGQQRGPGSIQRALELREAPGRNPHRAEAAAAAALGDLRRVEYAGPRVHREDSLPGQVGRATGGEGFGRHAGGPRRRAVRADPLGRCTQNQVPRMQG